MLVNNPPYIKYREGHTEAASQKKWRRKPVDKSLPVVRRTISQRLRSTFMPNGKREFVPRDQVFPLIVVYCLLLLHKNKLFHASFIHKNCSVPFLSAYFLFWEILNLNVTFAVCRKRDS